MRSSADPAWYNVGYGTWWYIDQQWVQATPVCFPQWTNTTAVIPNVWTIKDTTT